MKNALILHGTGNTSQGNWFPWLKKELESRGWYVWCPDLPQGEEPDLDRYYAHIIANNKWKFTPETVAVGHSSGGTALLKILQRLPESTKINRCITVGSFWKNRGWVSVRGLFRESFNYLKIKRRAKKFVIIHSDDDPHVPISHALYLTKKLDAEFVYIKGQGHFNLEKGPQYKKFPELLEKVIE